MYQAILYILTSLGYESINKLKLFTHFLFFILFSSNYIYNSYLNTVVRILESILCSMISIESKILQSVCNLYCPNQLLRQKYTTKYVLDLNSVIADSLSFNGSLLAKLKKGIPDMSLP